MSMNMESLTASRFLDEDCLDQGKELFGHHGVIYRNTSMSEDETPGTGSLSVVQYGFGKCIEWKASEVSVDADCQEQEWAMVNATRRRTISGSLDTLGARTSLKLPLTEIKGYKVEQKKTRLTIVPKDSRVHHIFYFQFGNSDGLTQILKSFITSKRSKQDKKFYVVVGEKNAKTLPNSFSELTLSERPDTVWNFVSNLKDRPYETTLNTFSKFSEYLLYRPPECRQSDDEEVVGDMVSSMETSSADDGGFSLLDSTSPPRPAPPRSSPLDALQWAAAADPQGRITNPDSIKQIIFRGGCEPSLRFEVWKFLLGYYPWNSTVGERLELKKQKVDYYFRMKLQWRSLSPEQEARFSAFRERKNLIEKDVYRTDRTMEFFAGDANPNLALLSDILTTYAMYNFDLGYVQGMSDLLSPILFLMGNEVDAFWCFVGFMDKVYRNFDEDQAGMKKQLSQLSTLLSAAEPQLSSYLDQKESGNLFFCFRWLLVWFKREFSHQDIMTLWEVLWTGLPCSNFHLVICVAILESEKRILMEKHYGFTEILKHFNELSGKLDVDGLLSRAEGVYLSLCNSTDRLTASTRRVLGLSSTPATTSSEEEQDDPPSHDARLENAYEQNWPIMTF